MLLLVTYHAPHVLPPAPSSGVVTWSRPGTNLLVQSEFFSGMNTWTVGGRCYHLPQELLSCSFLWPRSLSRGDNLNKVEKTSRSSKQSQDWQRWELQQEKKKPQQGQLSYSCPWGPTSYFLSLPLFLWATLVVSPCILFLGDGLLLFITKRGLDHSSKQQQWGMWLTVKYLKMKGPHFLYWD